MGTHSPARIPMKKRAMAIALAAGVALSSASVVGQVHADGAVAQAAEAATAAETIQLEGIVRRGTDARYDGELYAPGTVNDEENGNYAFRFTIDLNKVTPETRLTLSTYRVIDGDTHYGFTYTGTRQRAVPILLGGKTVGTYTAAGSTAEIAFTDQLPPNAGTFVLDLDLYRYGKTYATAEQLNADPVAAKGSFEGLPVNVTRKDGAATTTARVEAGNTWYGNFYVAPDYTTKNFYDVAVVQDPSQENRIEINNGSVMAALDPGKFRESVTLTVRPLTGDAPKDGLPVGAWQISRSAVEPENIEFNAYEKPGEVQRRTPVAIPEGMEYEVNLSDAGELTVTFKNVPAGISPELKFKKLGVTNYTGDATYGLEQVAVASEPEGATTLANAYRRPVKRLDGGKVALVAKAEVTATVNGQTTAAGRPAVVGGNSATLTVTLTNTGNTSLSAPTITVGDSYSRQFDDVTIQPGKSEDVVITGWAAPLGEATSKVAVAFPVGAAAETSVFTSSIPTPDITVNGGEDAVAGETVPLRFTAPEGTIGSVEVRLPGGAPQTVAITGSAAALSEAFPAPGKFTVQARVVDPAGNRGEWSDKEFTVIPAAPDVTSNAPVAGTPTDFELSVPEGTTGVIEIVWPDGTATEHPIVDGKATASHTFPRPGDVQLKAAVIAPGGIRGVTREEPVAVGWPSDLSSIAGLKPDCRNALITDGVFGGLALVLALASQVRIPAIENTIAEAQKQAGIFNPQIAEAVGGWVPRAAAAGALIAVLAAFGDTYAKCSVGSGSSSSTAEGSSTTAN